MLQGIADAAGALERMTEAWATEDARQGQGRPQERLPGTSPDPAGRSPAATGEGEAGGEPARKPRVLVIDDDLASRTSMVMLVEAWGAEVVELDGVAALRGWLTRADTVHPSGPTIVIVDFHLGLDGNGLQAIDVLQEAWRPAPLRAVLITGDDDIRSMAARERPDLVVLRKPVEPRVLLEAAVRLAGG